MTVAVFSLVMNWYLNAVNCCLFLCLRQAVKLESTSLMLYEADTVLFVSQ